MTRKEGVAQSRLTLMETDSMSEAGHGPYQGQEQHTDPGVEHLPGPGDKDQSRPTVQTWEDKSTCKSQDLGLVPLAAGLDNHLFTTCGR
jgi:hypothetical protein